MSKTIFNDHGRVVILWVGESSQNPDTYLPGFCLLSQNELYGLSDMLRGSTKFKDELIELMKKHQFLDTLKG